MFEKILIKKRLRKCREDKSLTRPQVCELTGIPMKTLTGWELDKGLPRLDKAGILAELYGVSVDYILGRTDNPEINNSNKFREVSNLNNVNMVLR